MKFSVAVLLLLRATLTAADTSLPQGTLLELPRGKTTCRLQVAIDGDTSATEWAAFLDDLFAYFDRDGNGSLDRKEVGNIFPLPLPGGKSLTVTPGPDGKLSRDELKAFCRANGFTPIVATIEPSSGDDWRLGAVLLKTLDADRDGKVSAAELKRAPEAFRQWDLNEDDFIDRDELLGATVAPAKTPDVQVRLAKLDSKVDVLLRVRPAAKRDQASIEGTDARQCRLSESPTGGKYALLGPESSWVLVFKTTRTAPDITSAIEFLVAQFKDGLGKRDSLTKAELEQDPTLGGLEALIAFADRNGDGRLTLAELNAYLKLVERGVRCQVWLRVADRGGNLVPSLDTDGDGKLSYRELLRATDLRKGSDKGTALPHQFEMTLTGPAVKLWGGVQIPTRTERAPAKEQKNVTAPRWFQAMDRNSDNLITPREFLGSPDLFRKLDKDSDGVISAEEAIQSE